MSDALNVGADAGGEESHCALPVGAFPPGLRRRMVPRLAMGLGFAATTYLTRDELSYTATGLA